MVKFRVLPPPSRGDDMGGISVHDVDLNYSGDPSDVESWLEIDGAVGGDD